LGIDFNKEADPGMAEVKGARKRVAGSLFYSKGL
jgi:hypothetical protein